ncbi:MAG: tRNA (adenosine(37)-N6)-dimethylallyltransferase MiaA [Pseudomonadota bacterium]
METFDRSRPVLIAGPTASGKSALALAIAQADGRAVVNADALQVFDCWNVLTARPPEDDLRAAPHQLYGHVGYAQSYSVGDWLREVAPLLGQDPAPVIVGGTGLYFRALTEGLADIPPIAAKVREKADAALAAGALARLIAELDPETRAQIDTQNPARVQRAWEVLRSTGRGLASWQAATPAPLLPLHRAHGIVLHAPPDWLGPRIAGRFDAMLAGGAMEEVRAIAPHWDATFPASKAIGAAELLAVARGEMTLATARERAVIATRQYAKRQRTWFRARLGDWTWRNAWDLGAP